MRRSLVLFFLLLPVPLVAQIPVATVSTITPAAGLVAGGTIVHFHGTNLGSTSLLNCFTTDCLLSAKFGDAVGTVISAVGDELVAVAPPHAAGLVDVVLNLPFPQAQTLTLKNAFTYQDPDDTNVKLLLPIAVGTQGVFGTSWQTDVLAHNETPSPVVIAGTTIPPLATQKLALSPTLTGMFLQIPRSVFEGVTITTHVHDTTHDAESLGVDVPSIPETQFRRSVVLTGIPNDSRYRVLLRFYGYPGSYYGVVRVRDDATGELLSSQNVLLVASDLAYFQMPISAPQTSHVLRVEATTGASSQNPPIWAFITLTNNTTENVTTITPSVAAAPEAPSTVLAAGHWAHAGNCMSVSGSFASVTYNGCTFGTFNLGNADPDGHFEVDGSVSTGGVCCVPPQAAHFSGLLTGDTLALTIRTATQTIGPFTLVHGSTDPCTPLCP